MLTCLTMVKLFTEHLPLSLLQKTQICFLQQEGVICHAYALLTPKVLIFRAFSWGIVCFCTVIGSLRILKIAGENISVCLLFNPMANQITYIEGTQMQLRLQNFIQYNFNLSFFRIFFEQSLEGLYVPLCASPPGLC